MTIIKVLTVILAALGLATKMAVAASAQPEVTFTGTVRQVWEDGFRLDTESRSLRVDSWDLCGDFTERFVSVGDELTVTGEFDGRDFDAFTIASADSTNICS